MKKLLTSLIGFLPIIIFAQALEAKTVADS
jgi:hypothetical protein